MVYHHLEAVSLVDVESAEKRLVTCETVPDLCFDILGLAVVWIL